MARPKKLNFRLIEKAALGVAAVVSAYLFFQNQQLRQQGVAVVGVYDGDTLILADNKARVRLRHVDAPELEYCGGPQAKEVLTKLVEGKKVIIKEQIPDSGGRAMALVYIGNKLINLEMLKSGWARYHHDQSTQADKLKAVADQVKAERQGLFSPLCYQTENLAKPDCLIKGNKDKNSPKQLYYFPGCAQYDFTIVEKDLGENWFCSEKEAQQAGFTRSATCPAKWYAVPS